MTDFRGQMTEIGIRKSEWGSRKKEIRNLFSDTSDVLLYAPCPLLYALFARNSQHTTRNPQLATVSFEAVNSYISKKGKNG